MTVSPAKATEPIVMPFILDWGTGKGAAHCKVCGPSTEMAEPIKMVFGVSTRVCRRKHVLDDSTHWRHLLNTIEPLACGSSVTLCQFTLTVCHYSTALPVLRT